MRSGSEHCGCGSQLSKDDEDDEERGGRGGGGEEEEEQEEQEEEQEEEKEEEATDIKSNNPHLAGGEKNEPAAKLPGTSRYWSPLLLMNFTFFAAKLTISTGKIPISSRFPWQFSPPQHAEALSRR